ncbi:MAG: hypothetical protein ACK551_01590 [Vampirovibrionales bacterium]
MRLVRSSGYFPAFVPPVSTKAHSLHSVQPSQRQGLVNSLSNSFSRCGKTLHLLRCLKTHVGTLKLSSGGSKEASSITHIRVTIRQLNAELTALKSFNNNKLGPFIASVQAIVDNAGQIIRKEPLNILYPTYTEQKQGKNFTIAYEGLKIPVSFKNGQHCIERNPGTGKISGFDCSTLLKQINTTLTQGSPITFLSHLGHSVLNVADSILTYLERTLMPQVSAYSPT